MNDSSPTGMNRLVLLILGVCSLWLAPVWSPLVISIIVKAAPPVIQLWLIAMVLKWMLNKL